MIHKLNVIKDTTPHKIHKLTKNKRFIFHFNNCQPGTH